MKTDWIKMTDRQPTETDLPVWAYYADRENKYEFYMSGYAPKACTHWRPAKDDVPEPPQMEPTQMEPPQRERDNLALANYAEEHGMNPLFSGRTFWHAALAYERSEVLKLTVDVGQASWYTLKSAIEQIRARCQGGGK